ncbi:Cytochrom_B561 domain-containing protein [Cinnamomum micranthum f. kanehirae]|uniref:Cytochrom_B561 domain-containing protein n=1 Tax=Cinnamomum micranthum f. kanehirae TaxID=337451 RepID=A0A443PEA7_9MAGN|nr:Cytochrom_B561 domain-containing protein [Cinnamomum micranthum f. kanehirae]
MLKIPQTNSSLALEIIPKEEKKNKTLNSQTRISYREIEDDGRGDEEEEGGIVGMANRVINHAQETQSNRRQAKKAKDLTPDVEFHRAKKKIVPHDVFAQKNAGVDTRAHRDKLELKAVKDGAASYAALERKAELYDKLVRGELPDEEDKEKYSVDFFRKSVGQDETEQPEGNRDMSPGMPLEKEDEDPDFVQLNAKPVGPGRTGLSVSVNNDEHKRFVREVHEEANEAREKTSALKLRRQAQASAHREKLRQAYLKKQLEKLKAEKTQ